MIATKKSNKQIRNKDPENCLPARKAWNKTHQLIVKAMAKLLRVNERWPSKAELAEETGLCRLTIHRHFEQLKHEDIMLDELERLKRMPGRITAGAFICSRRGDIKAMRFAYNAMGML